ncbi:hypothetical protein [Kitasatospora griseola]|uniref:hypothetical protein n=1 Tax=Kitasatospora griseola TaxID=2064 RepID=UPI0038150D78
MVGVGRATARSSRGTAAVYWSKSIRLIGRLAPAPADGGGVHPLDVGALLRGVGSA